MHTRTCTAATGGCAWSLCGSAWSCLRRGVFACVPQRALLPGRQTRITAACRPAVCPCVQPYAPVAVSGSGGRPRQEAGSQVPVVAARASPPGARRAGLGWQHHPGAQGGLCGRAARCAGAAGTGCTPVTRPDTSAQKQRQAGCVFADRLRCTAARPGISATAWQVPSALCRRGMPRPCMSHGQR